ncbi:hypothetical protein [Streptomyces sp. AC555_RSS877]|uniref:hypothetical protein n=1 Tax=Streptomyces sp. AC555_RSS877 TaxID=2823688 RepID=UPI001C25B97F|nr:hypothetical protein [Streptomyces sp. AC555_RSS877]
MTDTSTPKPMEEGEDEGEQRTAVHLYQIQKILQEAWHNSPYSGAAIAVLHSATDPFDPDGESAVLRAADTYGRRLGCTRHLEAQGLPVFVAHLAAVWLLRRLGDQFGTDGTAAEPGIHGALDQLITHIWEQETIPRTNYDLTPDLVHACGRLRRAIRNESGEFGSGQYGTRLQTAADTARLYASGDLWAVHGRLIRSVSVALGTLAHETRRNSAQAALTETLHRSSRFTG